MGDGEFSGNGSVYWTIDHEDGADLKVKDKDDGRPTKNGGTNVHIKSKAHGRDALAVADVGKKKGHTGKFRVRLRFESSTGAQDALRGATPFLDSATGMWTLVLDVPVIPRDTPDDGPASEVRVDW
jgi:hypothetical protein